MSTENQPTTLRAAREATIDALCRGFATETLSLGERERRLETARSARTREELNRLLRDLPTDVPMQVEPRRRGEGARAPSTRPATAPRSGTAPSRPAPETSKHLALAIMGGTRRAGRWAPPTEMAAVAMMGGVELDFRDAVLEPGTTEINCFAFWGGVEITVPPGVEVESNGFALLGGFDQDAAVESRPVAGGPKIVVNGFALMGAVEIKVAAPTSERDGSW